MEGNANEPVPEIMDTPLYLYPDRVQVVRDYQDGIAPNHGRAQTKLVKRMQGNINTPVPEIMDTPYIFALFVCRW
jgi:hypothetical protein